MCARVSQISRNELVSHTLLDNVDYSNLRQILIIERPLAEANRWQGNSRPLLKRRDDHSFVLSIYRWHGAANTWEWHETDFGEASLRHIEVRVVIEQRRSRCKHGGH